MTSSRLYFWKAISVEGKLISGEYPASRKTRVRLHLLQKGYFPSSIKAGPRLIAKYWRAHTVMAVTQQLTTLLQAGLPLNNALLLLKEQHSCTVWRYLLDQIHVMINQGKTLSQALAQFPEVFSSFYRELIAMGELTGQLTECCDLLTQQQERSLYLQQKIKKSLRYPAFVILFALAIAMLMLLFVLPEFQKIYQNFDAQLPGFTQALISLSQYLQESGSVIASCFSTCWLFYMKKLRFNKRWKSREQRILLKIPLLKKITKSGCLSHIFRTLAITQRTGISLLEGLTATQKLIDNHQYQSVLKEIHQKIQNGLTFSGTIASHPLFSSLSYQLIRIGEESGKLEEMLSKLAEHYEKETEQYSETIAKAIEPLMMLVIGSLVGSLVIAMYLPIFQMGNVLG